IGCMIKRAGFVSISAVPTKIASLYNVFAISRQIRVFSTCNQNVAWETNPYLLNKRHRKVCMLLY
ncbi:cleavage and polyadenylation specificity factor subunit 3, partial [Trichinella spiralis]|uniref:cleavage and polyadenylation specificity factor subunit 3 n=1 Tax=Trichinella spiralis TaxID=6334 RepID=UPI0001EFBA10